MAKMDEEKILEKVRRLFELAKSSNQHESEAAAAKAQELLHKYNLSRADVPTDEKLPYVSETIVLKNKSTWAGLLHNALAKANGGISVKGRQPWQRTVIGQRHALEIIEYSYVQMEKRIRWLADTAWDIYLGDEYEGAYKEAFARGLVASLKKRLETQKQTLTNDSPESTALVVKQNAELDAAVRMFFPEGLIMVSSGRVSADGYNSGHAAGKHLNVHAGITGAAAGVRRLN